MDQIKTGLLIKRLRLKNKLTQLALAKKIGVSDKTVSKWERGLAAPDISLLPVISDILSVSTDILLSGEMEENSMINGNMKKTELYVCPICGNIIAALENAEVSCCGRRLEPIKAVKADEEHTLNIEKSDGGLFITSPHPMTREHYISFAVFLTGDTMIIKKLYPEWDCQIRLPFFAHGRLLWYCTRHGLFYKDI